MLDVECVGGAQLYCSAGQTKKFREWDCIFGSQSANLKRARVQNYIRAENTPQVRGQRMRSWRSSLMRLRCTSFFVGYRQSHAWRKN